MMMMIVCRTIGRFVLLLALLALVGTCCCDGFVDDVQQQHRASSLRSTPGRVRGGVSPPCYHPRHHQQQHDDNLLQQQRRPLSAPSSPHAVSSLHIRAARRSSTIDNIELNDKQQRAVSDFCTSTNNFWRQLVIKPVRDYVENRPAASDNDIPFWDKLITPPTLPGIPRPVWFTILASVPTGLAWYGYYKFSVEEELYQYELQEEGKVTGCGGYGTLFPFVYGILIGTPLSFLHVPGGDFVLEAAALWILLGQVNLYRRVNELCSEKKAVIDAIDGLNKDEPAPLYTWWALLPPPLDVVVGLRQVHFLSEYWRVQRALPYEKDVVAVDLFPFISAPRFTLKQFFRTPSMWFWFTKDWDDFDQFDFLKD